MKEIKLPVSRCIVSQVIDLQEALPELAAGKVVSFGTIDFSHSKELDQARLNGGKIIWCAICLEKKLEGIISTYMFPPSVPPNDKGRSFFLNRILSSDLFSYSAKKGLVVTIVNQDDLLQGRDKDRLSRLLKEVMDYRNAFAHGDIIYHADNGCMLRCWQGGPKTSILDDEYWDQVEDCFITTHDLVDQIGSSLRDKHHKEQA